MSLHVFGGETGGKETTWETQTWMEVYYYDGSSGSGMGGTDWIDLA